MAREFLNKHRPSMVIASSRYAADDLVRSACDLALVGVHRYTFRDLVYVLSGPRMSARGLSPVSGLARDALTAVVARKVKLGFLREASGFPGFARALSRTILDLRLNRVDPQKLQEVGQTGPDLALLLQQYEVELAEREFADYPLRVELAIEEARSLDPVALVVLDVKLRSASERELLKLIEERAPAKLVLPANDVADPVNCLTAVRRFALSRQPSPRRARDDSFDFFSASSESLECVEIARRILHGALPFDQTAVLLRNPQRHGLLVREAFERAGIPAWFTQGAQKPNLAGRAFLILLRCRVERFSARRFAEYLSLAQSPVSGSVRWERLLREAAVIDRFERWETRLRALQEKLRTTGASRASDLEALDGLIDFALPMMSLLASMPESATWGEWVAKLDALAMLALGNPASVQEVLEELAPVGDFGPVTLGEVVRMMERSLLSFRDPETGNRYGRVFVAPIEEARGMKFRAVFVPGLNEGVFPRPVREDPLLLDEQRSLLGIATSEDDAELLHTATACATERIVFSCSRVDLATGRPRVPSFFAAEVLNAAYGAGADVTKLLDEAKSASETRIGWSAPSQPFDSIDDAEYDLAAFRIAVKEKTDGGYAWIGALNPHTKRAIETRIRRWRKEWSSADGMIVSEFEGSDILSGLRLRERAYSVSALQEFAKCPYKFFLSEIARLAPVEEPDALERMDALVRGRLYHNVLFRLFTSGREDELDAILHGLAQELAEEYAPPVRGVWDADVEKLRADLLGWQAIRDVDWKPVHVELSFGLADRSQRDPSSAAEDVTVEDGYRLRGSIDLVEQNSAGELRVIDHKTGRFPFDLRNCVVGKGEVLQPVLYALAVEKLLGEAPRQAQLSYATLRGAYQTIGIPIDIESRRRAGQVLFLIDRWINQAFLPASPRKDACKECSFLAVCGPYEELRAKEKSQFELHALQDVRKLP